jgi:hypothetical protein
MTMRRAAFLQSEIERVLRAAAKTGATVQFDMKTLVFTIFPPKNPDAPSEETRYAPDGKENWDDY